MNEHIHEQPNNRESKELSQPFANVVYREGNSFMDAITSELRRAERGAVKGIALIDNDENMDVWDTVEGFTSAIGELKGPVISDKTTLDNLIEAGYNPICAYDALTSDWSSIEKIQKRIKPIIEEVQSQGKILVPVITHLEDHLWGMKLSKEEEDLAREYAKPIIYDPFEGEYPDIVGRSKGELYAGLFHRLGSPVINEGYFTDKPRAGEMHKAVQALNLDRERVVLGIDHHMRGLRSALGNCGILDYPVVPICPCCIGFKASEIPSLTNLGFNLFPMFHKVELGDVMNYLLTRIEKNQNE